MLKELGFSLEQIGNILKAQLGAAELRSMLMLRRSDAQRALATETPLPAPRPSCSNANRLGSSSGRSPALVASARSAPWPRRRCGAKARSEPR